jgi:RNA recognition motif-containing protein
MNIFVAKLSSETTGEDLQNLFAHYGEVESAKVIIDRETGNSKRYGFVEMPNEAEAKEAINDLNESEFQGSTIIAKESQPRGDQRSDRRDFRRDNRGGGYGNRDSRRSGNRPYNRDNDQRRDYNRRYENKRY